MRRSESKNAGSPRSDVNGGVDSSDSGDPAFAGSRSLPNGLREIDRCAARHYPSAGKIRYFAHSPEHQRKA